MSLAKYLQALREKTHLSERGLYPVLARHVIEGVLGYPERSYRVEPKQQRGVPDVQLLSDDGAPWVIGEVKLDDEELRDPTRRSIVWEGQVRAYLQPATVHVLLAAPHTFYVFDVVGDLRAGVEVSGEALINPLTGRQSPLGEVAFGDALRLISFEEASSRRKYERFRRGEAPSGYLPLTDETLPHFEATFQYASEALLRCARVAWDALVLDYQAFQAEMERLAGLELWAGSNEKALRKIQEKRFRARRKYRLARRIHEDDFPQFTYTQQYAGTHGEEALLEVYLTDTVYVILSRLLFVRLCEDLGLVRKKVSNQALAVWAALVDNLEEGYQDLLRLAFKDARRVYSRLFEDTVFDWYGETDGNLADLLERVLYRLNAFAFSGVDRDLLGKIYQRFLPPAKRKRLGEFYTDDEIVDYILWRVGFTEDPHPGSRLLLDPACGSNTFGVRAAAQLLGRFADSPAQHQIERVREVLVGYDVNPFAVFIAQMSLLFTLLPQYREAKAAHPQFRLPPFRVHNINSLLEDAQSDLAGVANGTEEELEFADGQFDYVVGNPPYVRNERVPEADRGALAQAYADIRHRNTDLAAYFVHRALDHWLRGDGKLGMVVSLGLANSDATRKLREYLRQWRIEEVVSLEWMATDLFAGADIVPMLLFVSQTKRTHRDPVSLVSGLRTKEDLRRCMTDPAFRKRHTTALPRKAWEDLSPFGDWCLEVKRGDVPLLQHLGGAPTLRDAGLGVAHYGVKVGSGREAVGAVVPREEASESCRPFAKGLDVARWGLSEPGNAIDTLRLGSVADPSIWAWWPNRPAGAAAISDAACVIVPGVYVTLTASVIDPAAHLANDSTRVVLPRRGTAHALCALVNSLPSRYYHFLAMRAAILLRRRSTIYPRTIESLPCPDLDGAGLERLDALSREAHAICAEADVDEPRLVQADRASWRDLRRAFVLLDFSGWPEDAVLSLASLPDTAVAGKVLTVGEARVAGDEAGLTLLAWLLQGQGGAVTRESTGALELPRDPATRAGAVAAIRQRVAARGTLLGRLTEVEEEIDDRVMDGLGLSADQRAYLRERCCEFPLSETVMRPRYLWSEDRKRQALRRYDEGRRYR